MTDDKTRIKASSKLYLCSSFFPANLNIGNEFLCALRIHEKLKTFLCIFPEQSILKTEFPMVKLWNSDVLVNIKFIWLTLWPVLWPVWLGWTWEIWYLLWSKSEFYNPRHWKDRLGKVEYMCNYYIAYFLYVVNVVVFYYWSLVMSLIIDLDIVLHCSIFK